MGNDLMEVRTWQEIVNDARTIQEVMNSVMKDKIHYGLIPGCGDKPTLFKPGAEKILSTFKIAVDPIVEDLSTDKVVRYRVNARGLHMGSGNFVGAGVGECSSAEEKYAWKKSSTPEEWEATSEGDRREKHCKGYDGPNYTIKQIRQNPADIANTVLKMAKKRAQIDLCLTATAASDCFAQDLEDLPEGVREGVAEGESAPLTKPKAKPAAEKPKSTHQKEDGNGNGPVISEPQRKRFFAIWKGAGKKPEDVKVHLKQETGSESSKDIPKSKYESLCKWAESKGEDEEIPFA